MDTASRAVSILIIRAQEVAAALAQQVVDFFIIEVKPVIALYLPLNLSLLYTLCGHLSTTEGHKFLIFFFRFFVHSVQNL